MEDKSGPAFPVAEDHRVADEFPWTCGLTKREWFAGQIAAGMAAFSGTAGLSYGPGDIAGRAFQVADALIAAGKETSHD